MADYVIRGEIDGSKVQLSPDVPLRVAAVRDGEILVSTALEQPRRGPMRYELRFPLELPCGFHLIVGRLDVPTHVFVGSPLVQRWISPETMSQGKKG